MGLMTVDRPRSGPLQGATLGERLEDALRQIGISKSELGRRIGVGHRQVQKWVRGSQPEPGSIAKIVGAIDVTADELIGIAEGQAPPFPGWREFIESPIGRSTSEDERRALAGMPWPPGREPTRLAYEQALSAIRMTIPRSS